MIVTIDDDGNDNNNNNNNNKTISKKDAVFYFICGMFGDAIPGFFFSTTVLLALTPDGKPALLSLCSNIGAVLGISIATWFLVKLNPQIRVIFNGTAQAIGILLSWFLPYPANLIAGVALLNIGFTGMLATIMPLSTYAGMTATKSYQIGFSAAPIFGLTLVKICDAAGFNKNGLFGVALAMPILNMISFFCLDHSVWNVVDEDGVGVDVGVDVGIDVGVDVDVGVVNVDVDVDVDVDDANTNDNCVDLEVDDNTTIEEEKSNDNSTTTKNTVCSSATGMGKESNDKCGEGSDEIRSLRDLRQIENDFKKPKQQQRSNKSFAKNIRDSLGSEMKPMTLKDYMLASKEMLKYWALYILTFCFGPFFHSVLYQPNLVESSASYHGIEGMAGSKTSDTILLVNHIFLSGMGEVMTVGGRNIDIYAQLTGVIEHRIITFPKFHIVPKISPYYLWIPAGGTVLLNVIAIMGVAYGAFPPMPVWAVYILSTMVYVLVFTVQLYTPLFVMRDKNLTSRYGEFHQQSLFLVTSVTRLLVDTLAVAWFGNSILNKCKSVYEDVYENTSCSWEEDAI